MRQHCTTTPFDKSHFHKIWISAFLFLVIAFVEVFMLACHGPARHSENGRGPWATQHG
jgi:hypothetical protein